MPRLLLWMPTVISQSHLLEWHLPSHPKQLSSSSVLADICTWDPRVCVCRQVYGVSRSEMRWHITFARTVKTWGEKRVKNVRDIVWHRNHSEQNQRIKFSWTNGALMTRLLAELDWIKASCHLLWSAAANCCYYYCYCYTYRYNYCYCYFYSLRYCYFVTATTSVDAAVAVVAIASTTATDCRSSLLTANCCSCYFNC